MKAIKAVCIWIMSFTWGLPMTLVGCFVSIALLLTGHKPRLHHYFVCFEVGDDWGGFSCGCFFVICRNATSHVRRHECGHCLQNIALGIFMPFVVSIPSCVRYWYRELLVRSGKKKRHDMSDYDSVWFEGWATKLGEKYFR